MWTLHYTKEAQQDLENVFLYISEVFQAPDTAKKLMRQIIFEIENLNVFPLKYRRYNEEPWRSQGLRYLAVGNYLVFYRPNEVDETIYIIRILYSKMNLSDQLPYD